MLQIIALIFAFGWNSQSAPSKSRVWQNPEAPIRTERGTAKRLFIVGYSGQVILGAQKKGVNDIVVRASRYVESDSLMGSDPGELFRQLIIKVTSIDDRIEIRSQLPPNRGDWERWILGKQLPQVKLEVWAPENLNLEIYWMRGDVQVNRWKAGVLVTHQIGKVDIGEISGDVILKTMHGQSSVERIKGDVTVENFASQLSVNGISGNLKFRTFSGDANIKKVVGPSSLSNQKGHLVASDFSGATEVYCGAGNLHLSQQKGPLRGKADAGTIEAKLSGPADVRLTAVTGNIILSAPKRSSANVYMFTNKGDLRAPNSLEQKRTANGKSVVGKLSGSESGRINMSSESGDLSLRSL